MKKVKRRAWGHAACFLIVGVLIGMFGIYIGEIDDAPGAAFMGIILMIGLAVIGIRLVWRKHL